MWKFFALLICFVLALEGPAQVNFIFDRHKADSLEQILSSTSGRHRVDVLNSLSFLLNRHDPAKSANYAKEALMIARGLDYQEGEAYSLYNQGVLYYLDAEFSNASEKLFASLHIYEELQDTAMIIDVYYQLAGTVFFSETDKDKGKEYLTEALNLALSSSDHLRVAQIYASFGYVANVHAGDGKTGKQMFENYYRYIEGITVSRIEEALMIASYGDSFKLLGDERTAINKYLVSLTMYNPEVIEDRALMAQNSSTLGGMYLSIGKADSALYYYQYGIDLSRKNEHLYGLYRNYYNLARYYRTSGKNDLAEQCCDSAIYYGAKSLESGSFYGKAELEGVPGVSMEIYMPISKGYKQYLAWSFIKWSHELLNEIYEATGRISNAYENSKSLASIKDSLTAYERNKELREIQARFETGKKEEEIVRLSQANELQQMKIRQNNLFMFGLGGMIILIILLGIILLRQNKLKADHQAILLKQRLFRSQMNPHFIFNSLGSIQSSIINEEPDKAVRYLSRFSKLMRSILDSTTEELIPLQEEIETVENYLSLQKVRYADKFDYKIDIDPGIDIDSVMIPPMLAQPFIENAIEHGIKNKIGKGRIQVRIRRSNNRTIEQSNSRTVEQLNNRTIEQSNSRTIEQTIRQGADTVFEVEDDGVGRERARDLLLKQEESHKSLATVITRERIAALNRKSKKKITLEIIDLKDDEGNARGTLVRFGIPV
jgi:tetratricopeptide (TPR) repeat protein